MKEEAAPAPDPAPADAAPPPADAPADGAPPEPAAPESAPAVPDSAPAAPAPAPAPETNGHGTDTNADRESLLGKAGDVRSLQTRARHKNHMLTLSFVDYALLSSSVYAARYS